MNVITGLPRSGSTLLCNILNQNPRFHASSTSILPQLVGVLIKNWSDAPETRGALTRDESGTRGRLARSLKGLCEGWYHDQLEEGKIIFDKARAWSYHLMALQRIFPESKVLVTVRDLREVFASVEKQHRKEPLLDLGGNAQEKTIWGRAEQMFRPDGLIGGPVEGVMDMSRRQLDTLIIKYERLVEQPKAVMKSVYEYLGEDAHEHDFENVESTAEDLDSLYLNKYPHNGSGKVEPAALDSWQGLFTPDLANQIMERFPSYNRVFGYT